MEAIEEPESERLVLEWSVADTKSLLSQLQGKLPKHDAMSFSKRITRIMRDGISVGEHTPEECRAQLDRILSNVSAPDKTAHTCSLHLFFSIFFWVSRDYFLSNGICSNLFLDQIFFRGYLM